MDKPPFFHRPSMRHRRSLQDKAPSARSLRRLDRHSFNSATPSAFHSLHVSLLEHIQVQFLKALVPANKLASPRYVMKVTNLALDRSWEMVRPFKDFYELKEDLVRALDHGHLCKSNCPWMYMFLTHNFPRRHIFRSRQASVVSGRLTELDTFMNTLLKIMKEGRSLDCSISAHAVPKVVFNFLFEGMVFDRSDFTNTILESRVSIHNGPNDVSSNNSTQEDVCTICGRSLKQLDSSFIASDPATASLSSSSNEGASNDEAEPSTNEPAERVSTSAADLHARMSSSLTTLTCGHRFHDECILEKLNQSLQCPLCVDAKST